MGTRAQQDASGKPLIYPGPDGRTQYISGRPVAWWECNCSERRVIHARAEHDVYGPDGIPLEGPATGAADYAELLAWSRPIAERSALYSWMFAEWTAYRDIATLEGERYCEAIRGARAMRHRAVAPPPSTRRRQRAPNAPPIG